MANEKKKLAWRAAHSDILPHLAGVVKKLLVIQPSSESTERVFSLLKNAFDDQRDDALDHYDVYSRHPDVYSSETALENTFYYKLRFA